DKRSIAFERCFWSAFVANFQGIYKPMSEFSVQSRKVQDLLAARFDEGLTDEQWDSLRTLLASCERLRAFFIEQTTFYALIADEARGSSSVESNFASSPAESRSGAFRDATPQMLRRHATVSIGLAAVSALLFRAVMSVVRSPNDAAGIRGV